MSPARMTFSKILLAPGFIVGDRGRTGPILRRLEDRDASESGGRLGSLPDLQKTPHVWLHCR